ncbi:MAG TPA: hypothetical protein VF503_13510 [Sphingobium sp.]|uniref:hypothetical protein n=1 Tax=Sphingobium sp. TaxID=1912891 RepID=UPI002ED386D1
MFSAIRKKPSDFRVECFVLDLKRRNATGGWTGSELRGTTGIARTDLLHNTPGRWNAPGLARSLFWFLFQPTAQGTLPTHFATTSGEAVPEAIMVLTLWRQRAQLQR